MTALITCGHARGALSATRSLGRAGEAVAVGAPTRPALAMWSRYATSTFLTPDPATDAKLFADQVADQAHGRRATCIMVASDPAAWALSKWRSALPEGCQAILPPHDALVRAHDRSAFLDLAGALGLGTLETVRVHSREEVEPALRRISKIGLPAMVRPLVSHVEREGRSLRDKGDIPVARLRDLRRLLYARPDLVEAGVIIEPYPEGQTLGYGAVCVEGKVVAEIFQESIRERRVLSSQTTLAHTVEPTAEVRRVGRTILEALGWQGPAMIELLRAKADGGLRLVSVIGRMWSSVQLAIDADVDVPMLLLRLAQGDRLVPGRVAKPNVRFRWLVGDLRQAALTARSRQDVLDGGFGVGRRLKAVAQIVDPRAYARISMDVMDQSDPMPFVYELQGWLQEGSR